MHSLYPFTKNKIKILCQLQTTLNKLGTLLFEIISTFKKDLESEQSAECKQKQLEEEQKKELQLVLMNSLCCLSYLVPGIKNSPSFWSKFMDLVSFPDPPIQCMVMDCMKDIVEVDQNHLEQMLNLGLLKVLNDPFTSKDVGARHKALGLLAVIVSTNNGKYVRGVISSGFMKPLLELMGNDDLSRLTIVKIIRFMTMDRGVCHELVAKSSIISELGSALNSFKKFDPVIRDVYHYVGPTYNFEFVEDVLFALHNILKCGDIQGFIHKFDMELLDRISDVMMKMSSAKGIETWRNNSELSLEERLVSLLENIKCIHLQCNTPMANEAKEFVDDLIMNFRKSLSANQHKNSQIPSWWQSMDTKS